MNKIYKHIWSKSLNCMIVVGEGVKGSQGKKSGRRKLATALISSITLGSSALAQTVLPTGGQVVAGQATIASNGSAMTIRQATDKAILNWQSFSIGKDAAVTFVQPGASSIALNRVVGLAPSEILGSLNANGQVFLVNPNGVLVGRSGTVQTGAFVASTLGLADQDFQAGKFQFSGEGRAIVNQGSIKGSVVALIAPVVTNQGSIQGNTVLAGGTDALLDFDGDGLLSVQVKASTLATLVDNQGLIQADGGKVLLTAKGASDALQGVVSNSGTIQAHTVASKDGRILLLGDMEHGAANVGGTLDASAPQGGDGGFIETSAAHVKVADSARITTRAASGKSGTWLIDPNDFTIAAAGGDMTGSAVTAALAGGDLSIATAVQGTAGGNGDIRVNDTVTWSANKLTLSAERNIAINAAMNGSGTAGLALEYGQGAVASGNTASYTVAAPVNLESTGSFSTKLGSDGTVADYTIITSLGAAGSSNDGTLQGIVGNLSGNYVLGADIDASATSAWNTGSGFTPIGDNSSRFSATFDGLGHVVTGLAINRPSTSNVGLFGSVDTSGVVKNVGLSGGSVAGGDYVGQLVGLNMGTITSSYATGSVTANDQVGGLVGKNSSGTISASHAAGNVTMTSDDSRGGGLLGVFDGGTIANSYATGQVSGLDTIGGLVGYQIWGTIANSYATGQVSGRSKVGGLVGYQNDGTISDTYTTGNVSSSNWGVGGLIGNLNGGTIANSYTTGQVSGVNTVGGLVGFQNGGKVSVTYATGSVSASNWNVGGLIGELSGGELANSYATGQVSGVVNVGGLIGGLNGGKVANSYATGQVSGANTVGGLMGVQKSGTEVSDTYATGNVSSSDWGVGGLIGKLDGGKVANSFATGQVSGVNTVGGLVGFQNSGTVVSGTYATGIVSASNREVGGLIGFLNGGTVANSYATGQVSGVGAVGGLVGVQNNGAVVSYTSATGKVSASDRDVGGLVGVLDDGTVANAYATGQVSGDGTVGGLVGYQIKGTLSNIYASGNVSAVRDNAGGLIGYMNNGTISEAFAAGQVSGAFNVGGLVGVNNGATINHSYATGLVTGPNSGNVGGLIGYAGASATLSNSLWDTSTTGQSNGCGTDSAGTCTASGKTTQQMKDPFTFIDGAWDFASVWGKSQSGGNNGYMVLRAVDTTAYDDYVRLANTNLSRIYGAANPSLSDIALDGVGTNNASLAWGSAIAGATNVGSYSYGTSNVLSVTGNNGRSVYAEYGSGALTIGQAALTATASNASKTYDGLAYAGGNGLTYSGFVNGETAAVLSGSASFGGTAQGAVNAGDYTLTASGLSSGNYNISYADGALTVGKAALTATASNASKTYDGLAFSGGNGLTYAGFVNGETAAVLSGSASFGGTAQGAVNAGNYTLTASGLSSGNYNISYADGALTVGKAALTATASNASKTYDGLAFSGGNGLTYAGFVNGETAAVLSGSASFGGTAQGAVNAGDYTLTASGLSSGNYNISYADGALTVGKAALTATASNASKTYDKVAFSGDNGLTYAGFVNGETAAVLSGSASFGGTAQGAVNAGNYTLTASGLSSGNYNIAYVNGTLAVNKATITGVTGFTANNKTYDGTTAATLNTASASLTGVIAADSVSVLTGTGVFTDQNVGTGKTVNVAGLTFGGADAGNYAFATTTATATADISKAALTATASNASKTYDGLAFSGGNGLAYAGFVNGETAAVLSGSASFGGTAQGAVNAGNYTLTASGLSSGNYNISYADGALTVGKAALTATASNASKTYDGLAFSGGNGLTYSGFVNGESAAVLSGSASFGGTAQGAVNAGNYTLTASGLSSGNYNIAYADGALAVNKATITGVTGITASNKTYDGTTAATLNTASASFTGKVAGDNLSLATANGAFTDKNAGTGKTVNITGLTLDNASAGNYTLAATTATTTADISKAAISEVTGITAANKDVDGLTVATLNTTGAAFTGMVAGDSLNLAAAAGNFSDASVGVNKTVLITGLALGGGDASNYALTNTSGTTTASIADVVVAPTGSPPLSPQQIAIGSTSTIGGDTFAAPASAILSAGSEPLVAVMLEGASKTHVSLTCSEGNKQACSVR